MVFACDLSPGGVAELSVQEHQCQKLHQDVCESFGIACGMCGEDKPDNPAGYCKKVLSQGFCSKPKYRSKCQETCCFE
jgi:hypothetical protein